MLTQKQFKLLKFIEEYLNKNGLAPSYDEMKEGISLKSKSGIHALISSLEERGYLKRLPNKARAIDIIRAAGERRPSGIRDEVAKGDWPHLKTMHIPLYTTISSLISVESFRPSQEKVEVPTHLIPEGTTPHTLFAIKISGDFMKDAGVLNGDCLIITETSKVTNGNIVLAVVHGKEVALRRWSEEGDKIFLTAANKYFMPQVYDKDKVKIKGRLVGLFRQY